jgi:hypothetical protein
MLESEVIVGDSFVGLEIHAHTITPILPCESSRLFAVVGLCGDFASRFAFLGLLACLHVLGCL